MSLNTSIITVIHAGLVSDLDTVPYLNLLCSTSMYCNMYCCFITVTI